MRLFIFLVLLVIFIKPLVYFIAQLLDIAMLHGRAEALESKPILAGYHVLSLPVIIRNELINARVGFDVGNRFYFFVSHWSVIKDI